MHLVQIAPAINTIRHRLSSCSALSPSLILAHVLCSLFLTQIAPAMNTLMWSSPFTQQHLDILTRLGATTIPPIAKRLACGDVGVGAMAEPADVAAAVAAALARSTAAAAAAAAAEGGGGGEGGCGD
jgi:phosphopantothenoylcysteine synthetase/decarboxylase